MIWTPLPGGGSLNGYRYRDTLRPLSNQDLQESVEDSGARIEELAQDPAAPLGEWHEHGPALSVYAQWAVMALLERELITRDEYLRRLARLAQLQQRDGLYRGFPGIHYGRSRGWEAPSWWGTDIHQQHRQQLIAAQPEQYSREHFEHWIHQRDWRWAR